MADDTRVPRPRVFISSTITDMADLRDALKFWLEEMGYDVQLSEHTDFEHRPDAGTFDACFESIRTSNYYILLIGEACGSWYDEKLRVTVTRREYRIAYESWQQAQKPKLLSFVRKSVMASLRERRAAKVSPDAPSQLADAKFTEEFIREVRREEEVTEAAKGTGAYPGANWLTEYANFRDLTDGLRSGLNIRGPLARAALLENLRHELERNLRQTMMNFHGKPLYHHFYIDTLRRRVQIDAANLDTAIPLDFTEVKRLSMYLTAGPTPPGQFVHRALDQALLSEALLDYDVETDQFVPSTLLEALYRFREELDLYASRYQVISDIRYEVWQQWDAIRQTHQSGSMPSRTLTAIFGLHDNEQNIVRLLVAILRYLYHHTETVDFQTRPISPIMGESEKINAERVSGEELRDWLQADSWLLRVGSVDLTPEQQEVLEQQKKALEDLIGKDKTAELSHRIAAEKPVTPGEIKAIMEDVLTDDA